MIITPKFQNATYRETIFTRKEDQKNHDVQDMSQATFMNAIQQFKKENITLMYTELNNFEKAKETLDDEWIDEESKETQVFGIKDIWQIYQLDLNARTEKVEE